MPVKTNVEFTRQIETLVKHKSFVAHKHPDLLTDFADIIGGEYTVTRNDELYYIPNGKRIRLSMDESSSAVRSLLDVGFYLAHVAQPGDLLIVDEPELNLHPENQRKVARLFARLLNIGVKVFITTHSDYIIKVVSTTYGYGSLRKSPKHWTRSRGSAVSLPTPSSSRSTASLPLTPCSVATTGNVNVPITPSSLLRRKRGVSFTLSSIGPRRYLQTWSSSSKVPDASCFIASRSPRPFDLPRRGQRIWQKQLR
ncbi:MULTISPECIES: AAA family ATPase [unclassified Thiocapsa]|uniref:AAA family ATPase n=1 Tax=unclassified Thiocapsa TaxID=2641286 RepID=UPI0035B0BCC1